VCCTLDGFNMDYRSFTARVPWLRHLTWHNQFTERVDIDFGKPISVTSGSIKFTWKSVYDCHEMESRSSDFTIFEGTVTLNQF
jgi:hypothetical protein